MREPAPATAEVDCACSRARWALAAAMRSEVRMRFSVESK